MKTESHQPIGELDRHLFAQGRHWRIYDLLGAHPVIDADGSPRGYRFAVWAPAARHVSVVGRFNQWDPQAHKLTRDPSGIWFGHVESAQTGDLYKYQIETMEGQTVLRADPYGFWAEVPPGTASVLVELDGYTWSDGQWLERRRTRDWRSEPMAIYEVHLGSWRADPNHEHGWKNYRDTARELVEYCRQQGFTHIELLPVSEHPYTPSWGYQTVGYYSATSRYGHPHDLMHLIDLCHQHDIGVIVDWVPAHFPRDAHGLRRFDGTALYEHLDPRLGEHPDWGTMIFNYGRPQVRNFLIGSALFWLDRYHIDGLRVDAVASMLYLDYSRDEGQWVPNQYGGRENLEAIEFLRETNRQVHEQHPGALMIAEESTAWPRVTGPEDQGGLGFDLKWNMGWMNDTLRYFERKPLHRKFHHNELTFSLMYAWSEQFILPLSHDEVVHGKRSLVDKMPGDVWQKFANLRLLFAWMWTHPGKKLLFMGGELGQWREWNCEQELNWNLLEMEYEGVRHHAGVQALVRDLNRLLREQPALRQLDFSPRGFRWINADDWHNSVLTFLRQGTDPADDLLIALNFTPDVHENYPVHLPEPGQWQEILNTDDRAYGGSHVLNPHVVSTRPPDVDGDRASAPGNDGAGNGSTDSTANGPNHRLYLQIPPLGGTILRRSRAN